MPAVPGAVVTLVAAAGAPAAVPVAAVVTGGMAAAGFLLGPRLHGIPRPLSFLLGLGCLLALTGIAVPSAGQDGYGSLAADGLALPGYLLLVAGLVALLRARGRLERHAFTDGVIIALGAGLLSVTLLTVPAAHRLGRSPLLTAVAGIYPVIDIVLVLALLNLAFTTAVHTRSFHLLSGGVLLIVAGDLAHAWSGAYGDGPPPDAFSLPYFAAFTLLACAALHPSMADLARALPRPVQGWSWPRLALLMPALAAPYGLMLTGPQLPVRIRIAVAGAGMIAALFVRASSAVAGYAQAQEVFRFQATHDGLTGLPNRAAVSAAAERMLAGPRADGRTVWLTFLDLDGFKLVNDSWGHAAGDRVLAEVAHRLQSAVPPEAVLARLGGDEFVLLLVGHQDEAEGAADALLAALAAPLSVDDTEVVVTASAGLATGEGGAERLLRDADTAMYRAKADGRRRWVVFDPEMRRHVKDRLEIEAALRRALGNGELRTAYQPIVCLDSGVVLAAEALVRWRHPERGPIPPATFIPIAEDAGLIAAVGERVLADALRWTATWRRAGVVGEDFWVSVNVSPRQLRDDRIVAVVERELAAAGLPASALSLEITESVMLDESEVTQRVLLDLRALGVRLVVDDFGTGFSALGYLRRHPVTGVKIDRSFVDGLGRDSGDEVIVRAVVAMASALGLSVVAEGVEQEAQRAVLQGLGVTHGQGYLWGMAVDAATFATSPVTARTRQVDELMAAPRAPA
jgi:diguanylate cyclase